MGSSTVEGVQGSGGPESARDRLAVELLALHRAGGKRTYSSIAKHALAQKPSVVLSRTSIGEWLNGKSVPSPTARLTALVIAMTDTPPDLALQRLYRRALGEKRSPTGQNRGSRPRHPVPPTHIPHLDALHYVDSDRLYDLLSGQGREVAVPNLDWNHRRGLGHAEFRRVLVNELDKIALRAKRFTPDLDLRQLTDGDLLIFDTQVRTRNGASPRQVVELTGDLNRDPHIYIQRRGVRIVMSLKPQMITTDTAFSYFNEGTVLLAGVSRIKHRVTVSERTSMPETGKVQYLATPLVLGTVDVFNTHDDLRASPIFEALDMEADGMRTIGPWVPIADDVPASPPHDPRPGSAQ